MQPTMSHVACDIFQQGMTSAHRAVAAATLAKDGINLVKDEDVHCVTALLGRVRCGLEVRLQLLLALAEILVLMGQWLGYIGGCVVSMR